MPQNTDSNTDSDILAKKGVKNKVGATAIYGKTTYYLQLASGYHATKNGKGRISGSQFKKRTSKKVLKKSDSDNKTRQNE